MKKNNYCENCGEPIESEYDSYEELVIDLRSFAYKNSKHVSNYKLSKMHVLVEEHSEILENAIECAEKYIGIEYGNYIFKHKLLNDYREYNLIYTDNTENDLLRFVDDIDEVLLDKEKYINEIENLIEIIDENEDIKEFFQKIMFLLKLKNVDSKLMEYILKK